MARLTPEQQAEHDRVQKFLNEKLGGAGAQRLGDSLSLERQAANGVEKVDQFGGRTWDEATQSYRDKGASMQGRTAPQLDMAQANEARGFQMGSLGMLDNAARGNAPSQAATLAQVQGSDALRGGAAQAATARGGPGAQVAGLRAAMTPMGQQFNASGINAANARNKEMALDMGSLAGASAQARGQDIGAATTNAQLVAGQRALNEVGQQRYEGMAYDTRATQQQTGMTAQNQHQQLLAARDADRARQHAEKTDAAMTGFSTAASMGAGAVSASMSAKAAAAKRKKPEGTA